MKKILATLVALAVLVVMAVPNVFAVTYKDPGVSTSKPVDLQFPWDANTLVTGNSASYDLNLAIGAGTLCAAAESGTSTASAVLNELGLGGAVAHYGYEANTSSVAHTISLKPVSVNGSHYNLITIVGRGSMSLAELTSRMNIIQDALSAMRASANSRIDAELCLVRLCQPELSSGIDALESRIDRLEKMLAGGIPASARPAAPAVQAAPAAAPAPAPVPAPAPQPIPEPQMPDGSPLPEEPPPEDEPVYEPPAPEPEEPAAPEPTETEIPAPPPMEDPNSPGGSVSVDDPAFIDKLKDNLHEVLSVGLKHFMRDPTITYVLKANILNLYFPENFKYSLFNKPEVISAFRQEAYKLSGREINVVMHDGAYDQDAQTVTKDVHDLDRFKEVHFTGGNNNG